MIRKLKSGEYRLYSRKVDPRTHKRKNLGTFKSREPAEKHEHEVQYFKRPGGVSISIVRSHSAKPVARTCRPAGPG